MKWCCFFLVVTLAVVALLVCGGMFFPTSAYAGSLPCAPVLACDTLQHDSLHTDTLRELEVRPDSVLPVKRALEKTIGRSKGPRSMSLGDVIEKLSPGLNDKITHPFAIKQRKSERRKKKLLKALEHYESTKTFNELLDEAVRRQQFEDERAKREAEKNK